MELNPWIFTSGILGVLVGALLQYWINRHLKQHELELKARSDLYLRLFSQLRDLGKTKTEIQSLLCDAQIYASDEVLDLLHKIDVSKPIDDRFFYDLLVAVRKELRPRSKNRPLFTYVYCPREPSAPTGGATSGAPLS